MRYPSCPTSAPNVHGYAYVVVCIVPPTSEHTSAKPTEYPSTIWERGVSIAPIAEPYKGLIVGK